MINYRYSLSILVFTIIFLAACSKLENKPLELSSGEYLWDANDSIGTNASLFLNSIYSNLPNGFNRIGGNLLDAATDDAVASEDGSTISTFTNGGYSAFSNADNVWQSKYEAIRQSNLFLQNFHKVHLKKALIQEGRYWMAEARFLRSMFYYELIKRYGGVPLIGDKVMSLDDDLKLSRNTFDECVEYIVSECDTVKNELRPNPVPSGSYGRITQGVALTLKAKVLLLAASPLNNTTNDLNRWMRAKNAASDVIKLNAFQLVSNFSEILTRSNTEVILAYQRAQTFDLEINNAPIGYISGTSSSKGRTSPTQELVDAFGTIKGRPITSDIKSPLNVNGYDVTNPYLYRDPRLVYTIFYNGMQWLSRPVETYNGGKDRPGTSLVETKTGYYMRKFMGDFVNATAYSNQVHNFIIFRYADVLLSYAEATNEVDGPIDSVYTVLREIRKRAGIIEGTAPNTFGLDAALSKGQMRDIIRNERRVELAFEEQRFWDLRRWKIAESVYNKPLHGIRINKIGLGFTYSVEQLKMPFNFYSPRMYRYAIPYTEVAKNSNLQQNEGYQ